MRKVLIAWIFLAVAPLFAQSQWDRVKGDCEQKFQNYQQVKLSDLVVCMKFWETTRDVSSLKPEQRRFMASVFERVFIEASEHDSYLAKAAMVRLGVPPGPDSVKKREAFKHKKKKKKRRRYIPRPASKAEKKKA
jgi:cellulose biosynthesis protein BcsQ